MHGEFLLGAGTVLGALALAGLLFRRLRQSFIPAFILLGMAARPLVQDRHLVEVLATLGVVLLLFFMGLEFSLGALLRNRKRIVRDGVVDVATCLPIGFVTGLVMGWGFKGALLLAGAFYISSSAIIAKSVIELQRAADPETESALGVLVFEDLFIALFLAVLSGAVLVAEPSAASAAWGIGKALLFFGAVVLVAFRARPLLNRLFDLESDDLFILLIGSVVLLLSWGAVAAGLSEAIGAFLVGLALAETDHKARAERLFAPLQGLFATVFFLGFGLSIDPGTFGQVWPQALILAVLGVAVKVAGGWWIGQTSGLNQRSSLALGLTLIARGEFSIVLAGIAVAAGLPELGALLALLVLALSIIGTTAMQFSPQITRWVFPRRQARSLAEQGFSPELAAFDSVGSGHK
ncbi:MAG: cation:proton antiporter [Gemmatimonadota bacterium]|nr:cation:proton antiporter [Gemmatimonadota bacterium]